LNAERIVTVVELLPRDIDHDQIMMIVVGYWIAASVKLLPNIVKCSLIPNLSIFLGLV